MIPKPPKTARASYVPHFMLPTKSSVVKEDDRTTYRRKIEEHHREDMEKRPFKGSFQGKSSRNQSKKQLDSVQVSVMEEAEQKQYQTMREQPPSSSFFNRTID